MRQLTWNDLLFLPYAARWTIVLSVASFAGGAALGIAIALMRVSERRWLRWVAIAYIRGFQGTPLLLALAV